EEIGIELPMQLETGLPTVTTDLPDLEVPQDEGIPVPPLEEVTPVPDLPLEDEIPGPPPLPAQPLDGSVPDVTVPTITVPPTDPLTIPELP
ncbi:MAG: hypothetical protein ACRDZM_04180, partial [Acidimicrobiia bacterium]